MLYPTATGDLAKFPATKVDSTLVALFFCTEVDEMALANPVDYIDFLMFWFQWTVFLEPSDPSSLREVVMFCGDSFGILLDIKQSQPCDHIIPFVDIHVILES